MNEPKQTIERDGKGRFLKGSHANPHGRPKVPSAIKELKRQYTEEAYYTLFSLATEKGSHKVENVMAASILLDRLLAKEKSKHFSKQRSKFSKVKR